jgi:hypothetical protein
LLSTAGTDNHPQLSGLFHWFRRNLLLINPEDERREREQFTTRELSGERAARINELLRVADPRNHGRGGRVGREKTVSTVHPPVGTRRSRLRLAAGVLRCRSATSAAGS